MPQLFPFINLTLLLLIFTASLIAYKFTNLNSTNKFFDDHKIGQFLDQTKNMTSNFETQFDELCRSGSEFCVSAFRQLNEAFVRKIVVSRQIGKLLTFYQTVPEYRMAACILPKCASSITTKVFAYLYDETSYKAFDWNNSIGLR